MLQFEVMNVFTLKITVNDFFCDEASLDILHFRRRLYIIKKFSKNDK